MPVIRKQYLFASAIIVLAAFGFILIRSFSKQSNTLSGNQESYLSSGEVAAEISMSKDGYKPSELSIKPGQTVRFVNEGDTSLWPASNIHPTHDLYSEFDPQKEIKPGQSWTFTFHKKGRWRMHDHLFPYIKGLIRVE